MAGSAESCTLSGVNTLIIKKVSQPVDAHKRRNLSIFLRLDFSLFLPSFFFFFWPVLYSLEWEGASPTGALIQSLRLFVGMSSPSWVSSSHRDSTLALITPLRFDSVPVSRRTSWAPTDSRRLASRPASTYGAAAWNTMPSSGRCEWPRCPVRNRMPPICSNWDRASGTGE